MANPQVENGHTRIANELLEALMRSSIPPNQMQVLLCIVRKTYGYKKKVDYIANSQIQQATGLGKTVVSRALKGLNDRNMIHRDGKLCGVQKDWDQWLVSNSANSVIAGHDQEVSNTANSEKLAILSTELAVPLTELAILSTKVSSPAVTQKKKETIQKKLYKRKTPCRKKYGEFQNVLLTDEEYQKLQERLGPGLSGLIETLSAYMESKGRRYKSHYATLLNWSRRDDDAKDKRRRLPTKYTPTGDYPDL